MQVAEEKAQGGGWDITATIGPILSKQDVERFEKETGLAALPEMVFGDNRLRLSLPTPAKAADGQPAAGGAAVTLDFNALDALRGVAKGEQWTDRLQVKSSEEWTAEKVQEVSRAVAEDGQQVIATAAKFDFDWTYTTEYAGSVEGATVRDVPSNEAVIDMDLLMRPDPILYFKDVVLFEDELHDNGMASNSVKIRVMPTFWFILHRFWMRVDDVKIRVFETRFLHVFNSNKIVRERTVREQSCSSWNELHPGKDVHKYADPAEIAASLNLVSSTSSLITW